MYALLLPTSGEIEIMGNKIVANSKPKNVKALRKQVGLVFQFPEYQLFEETVLKDIMFAPKNFLKGEKEAEERAKEISKIIGIDDLLEKSPFSLSGGQMRKVAIAGILAANPDILVLDEPTVGLDPKQVIEIRELIKSFGKNHTVLVSSHILSEISQLCEKVIIIDKGEIIAVDTPENLESKTAETNILNVVVDDLNNKFESIKDEIKEIKSIELLQENEDKSKEYVVKTGKKDIRKELFEICAKENIIIVEMKQEEASFEDTFIQSVEGRKEYSQTEINKMAYEEEIELLRQEEAEEKHEKAISNPFSCFYVPVHAGWLRF